MLGFAAVQTILNEAIAGWKDANGQDPNLAIHSGNFGWDTKAQLLAATAFNLPLIDPTKIGNGKGDQTNLVIALRAGVSGFQRMPDGGPFLQDDKIQTIVQWIDAGAPD